MMKKFLLILLIALVLTLSVAPITVCAAQMNVVVEFSTGGPDTYPDGTKVLDGEYYALVWMPEGETFQGFNSDGSAIGNSKLVVKAPIAKNGCCPHVQFQIDEQQANREYPGGTWDLYLLDTRKYDNDGKNVTGVGGAVQGYVKINCDIISSLSPTGAKNGIVQSIPAGIQPPTIKDFKVINGMAFLFLQTTSSGIQYGVAAGQTPGALAPVPQQPVLGRDTGETIIITPAAGASGFYQGIVRTTYSTGNIWIVISIATAFFVTVLVLALIKMRKKTALADGTEKIDEK